MENWGGAMTAFIDTLAANETVSVVLSRYGETISSTAILGLFAGVALMATAIPRVVSAR